MEKCNVFEPERTPCLLKQGNKTFCDCDDCRRKPQHKKAEDAVVDIRDTDSLARIQK